MSGLIGQRVLVPRPESQAAAFVAELEAAGAVPVVVPLIAVMPPEDPAPADAAVDRLPRYDWVVCTSANGARALAERMALRGCAFPGGTRLAVVGPKTAQAAREAGLPVHAQPAEFRGGAVPAALGDLQSRRVLLPRADIAREEAPAALRAAAAVVDEVVFYRTVTAPLDAEKRAALEEGLDILTFTSPSTVTAFRALLGARADALAADAVIACIGPVTAAAVREVGWPVHVQPAEYTITALVAALQQELA